MASFQSKIFRISIWKPDLHIQNLIHFENIGISKKQHETFLQSIDNEADITQTYHGVISTSCQMDFLKFPFDEQSCDFVIGTDSGDENVLNYQTFINFGGSKSYFQEFQLRLEKIEEQIQWNKFAYKHQNQKNFSGTGFRVHLKRNWIVYFWSYYLPSFCLALIGSIGFLILPEIVPGRVALLLTLTLVLINFFIAIQEKIPKTEGLTAIGMYILGCLTFVFMALFEYAIILLRIKFYSKVENKNEAWSKKEKKIETKIDQIAAVLYLGLLLVFHIAYIFAYNF